MAKNPLFVSEDAAVLIDMSEVICLREYADSDNYFVMFFGGGTAFLNKEVGIELVRAWQDYHKPTTNNNALLEAAEHGKNLS